MFADIRQYMMLVTNDCSLLTKPYYNSTPIDLQMKSGDTVIPDYYNDPHICLTSMST